MSTSTSRVMAGYILRKIKNCLTYANIWVKIWLFYQDYYFTEYLMDRPNLLLADLWLRGRILRTAEIRLYGEERVDGSIYCVK